MGYRLLMFLMCTFLISSSIAAPATDNVVPEKFGIVPEEQLVGGVTAEQLTDDFIKDGLNGGLQDLESEAAGSQTTSNSPLQDLETELDQPKSFMNVEGYPTKMCSGVDKRKAGPSSGENSVVYQATKQIFADYDAQLAPLCLDAATNSDAITTATMDMQKAVQDVTLNLSSGPGSTSEDINALLNIGQLPPSLITKTEAEAMKKYCEHGTYSSDIKNLKDEPILAKLEKGVAEFDQCMDCMCKHGEAHCALTPICLKSIEDLTGVAGDLSKAKGFKDENGELIEELGPKHLEAVHKIIKHVSKKKKQLHARHGATPTKEQFHQVFSENDLVAETLVQVRGCHGISAATAVDFRAGAISCGFDCNEYAGAQEASLSCSAFEVVTVEIGVTFSPLTLFLKLKLCAPGVSDVIGEIQKIPCVNEILSDFGLDGGCLLLGIGYIDFTNGIGQIKPGINGLLSFNLFSIVKAQLDARAFFRWDSMLPTPASTGISTMTPFLYDCFRNIFQPRQRSAHECLNFMTQMFFMNPLTGSRRQCRDYMTAQSCCGNCDTTMEPYVARAEDWFGIKASAKLEVFDVRGWPWEWGYTTVWEETIYQNAWRTGGY